VLFLNPYSVFGPPLRNPLTEPLVSVGALGIVEVSGDLEVPGLMEEAKLLRIPGLLAALGSWELLVVTV
jgi:hypothetical protein